MKKTYRIKTNNQELLIRKQNESDATSRWIEFQKTRPWREISSWRKKEEREDLKKLELISKHHLEDLKSFWIIIWTGILKAEKQLFEKHFIFEYLIYFWRNAYESNVSLRNYKCFVVISGLLVCGHQKPYDRPSGTQ